MARAFIIGGFRRAVKIGLPAVLGALGLIVTVIVAGLLDLVPASFQPAYSRMFSLIDEAQGPVGFLISLMVAAFAFLKFLKKDDALRTSCNAAAGILFHGYAVNYLEPLRKIAARNKQRVLIARPTYSFLGDKDYISEIEGYLEDKGVKITRVGDEKSRGYKRLETGKREDARTAILDIPTTLVNASKVGENLESGGGASTKAREEVFTKLCDSFFRELDAWRQSNRFERTVIPVLPEKKEGLEELAERIYTALVKQ